MMAVLFFVSALDEQGMSIAARLHQRFSEIRVLLLEDVNDLLKIQDHDLVMHVSLDVDEPVMAGLEPRAANAGHACAGGIAAFLSKMRSIGRLSDVRVMDVPGQLDENGIVAVGEMLQKNTG